MPAEHREVGAAVTLTSPHIRPRSYHRTINGDDGDGWGTSMPNSNHDSRGRFAKKTGVTQTVSKARGWSTLDELGSPLGQRQGRGQLYGDFLPQLTGTRAIRTYGEMANNDATVGSILFAVEMLLRRMTWEEEPWDDTP